MNGSKGVRIVDPNYADTSGPVKMQGLSVPKTIRIVFDPVPCKRRINVSRLHGLNFENTLLVLQNFTAARKSSNITLTY